jgi:transcriptional regulator
MYVPPHFAEARRDVLHEAMEASFGTLVTLTSGGLMATHLPWLLDREAGEHGTLVGHVARANHQWDTSLPSPEALVLFLGPNAYVSPAWYAAKQVDGRVVPTWNYLAVHAYGPLRTFDDPDRLLDVVTRLTERHEQGRPEPWQVSDAPPAFVAGMLKGIVGVEIPITRLQGKWKLSQNRSAADRAGTIAGLRATRRPAEEAVAQVMADLAG